VDREGSSDSKITRFLLRIGLILIEVEWLRADALRPETYSHLLPDASAVVHTLGTLLADTKYKDALRKQDLAGAAASFLRLMGAGRNPLEESTDGYERLNRDSGL